MEADTEKQTYDSQLQKFTKKRSEREALQKSIIQLQQKIIILRTEINNYSEIESSQTSQQVRSDPGQSIEINKINEQIQKINKLIESQSRLLEQQSAQIQFKSKELALENETIKSKLSTQISHSSHELEDVNKSIAEKQRQFQLYQEIVEEQKIIEQLEAQLAEITKDSSQGASSNQNFHDLQSQIARYEAELRQIEQQNVAQSQKSQNKDDQSVKQAKNTLIQLEKQVSDGNHKRQQLETRLNKQKNQKISVLQQDIKNLQQKLAASQKQIASLNKIVDTKRAEKAAAQEDSKKNKNKKERNYTQELADANKTYENNLKQIDRQNQKLANVSKLSKSYVSQQNLQILQKQLSRHQLASGKTNIQIEESKKVKYLKDNQFLKSRINYLQSSSKQLEKQTDGAVKQLRKKGDQLVKQKLGLEKVINQTTNKLNQYMKQYPDHEKHKEQAKLEEKKRKAEEKERIRLQALKEKERKVQQKTLSKAKEEETEDLAAWQKWDKWESNLPQKDQTSLFNNQNVQIGCALIAIISILYLVFG